LKKQLEIKEKEVTDLRDAQSDMLKLMEGNQKEVDDLRKDLQYLRQNK
jgi:hypothetical protein